MKTLQDKRKLIVLSLLIAFTFFSCQKDQVIPNQETEIAANNFSINYISGENIPDIINLLSHDNGTSSKSNGSKSSMVSATFGSVFIESVLEVVDTLGNQNYSFTLIPTTPKPNSIFNLVVNASNGNIDMAIMEYRMSPSFAQEYINGTKTIAEFTGSIFKFPFSASSNVFSKTSGEPCVLNIDEVVNCDEVIVDGGGIVASGGGGGSTTIGDTNTYTGGDGGDVTHNYGPGGGSAVWVCDRYDEEHSGPTGCGDGSGTWIITLFPSSHLNKSSNIKSKSSTTDCCDDTDLVGSLGLNLTTQAILGIVDCLGEGTLADNQMDWISNTNNALKTTGIYNYLQENNCSTDAQEFAKATIDILSLPIITSNNLIDYKNAILRLTNHLKLYGNIEDEIYADYIDSLLPELDNMTMSEVHDIYLQVRATVNDLTIKYAIEIITPVVTDLVIPIITYAIFEATAGTAVKLLQKIPVSMVAQGIRLNKLVQKVVQLGIQGDQAHVRIIQISSPVTRAEELFLALSRDAVSTIEVSPGVIKATMGNGNFITYRTISSSGFPATIDLNFPAIFGSQNQIIKFILP